MYCIIDFKSRNEWYCNLSNYITKIDIEGLHSVYNLSCEFKSGINIIYGSNGSGKTTLLHIAANALNNEWGRFHHLAFNKISIFFDDGENRIITKEVENRGSSKHQHIIVNVNGVRKSEYCSLNEYYVRGGTENYEPLPDVKDHKAAYFPAFRGMLEGTQILAEKIREQVKQTNIDTEILLNWSNNAFARQVHGEFVPKINFESSVERLFFKLNSEINSSVNNIHRIDSELLQSLPTSILKSNSQSFPSKIKSTLENIDLLISKLQHYPVYVENVVGELRIEVGKMKSDDFANKVVFAYEEILTQMLAARKEHLGAIDIFFKYLNSYFSCKEFRFLTPSQEQNKTEYFELFSEGTIVPIDTGLSSGERQLVTLLFASLGLNEEEILLIDEPELSLSPPWQIKLLSDMQDLAEDRQVIACTHSSTMSIEFDDDRIIHLPPLCKA